MNPYKESSAAIKARWIAKFDERGALLPIRKALDKMLAAHDVLHTKRDEFAANKLLSRDGVLDATRKLAASETAPHVARTKAALVKAEQRIAERRVKLLPTVKDKTDVAAAMLRAEIRSKIGKGTGDALKLLLDAPDTDWRIVEALIELPRSLSGVPPETYDRAIETLIERTHPTELAALNEEEEALEVVRAAVEVTEGGLRSATNISNGIPFDAWFAEATADVKTDDQSGEDAALAVEGLAADASKLSLKARSDLVSRLLATNTDELAGKVAA